MPGRDFALVQDGVNPHILRMLEGTCSLDAAHMYFTDSVCLLMRICVLLATYTLVLTLVKIPHFYARASVSY